MLHHLKTTLNEQTCQVSEVDFSYSINSRSWVITKNILWMWQKYFVFWTAIFHREENIELSYMAYEKRIFRAIFLWKDKNCLMNVKLKPIYYHYGNLRNKDPHLMNPIQLSSSTLLLRVACVVNSPYTPCGLIRFECLFIMFTIERLTKKAACTHHHRQHDHVELG